MTPTEAEQLAKRIINTWRGGPPLVEWIEELLEMDAGAAGTAYVRLKREIDHAPSLARFWAEYRSLNTVDGKPKQQCNWCDNTGWVDAGQYRWRSDIHTGVQPCTHCPEGRQREVSEAWTKATEREFVGETEAGRVLAALGAEFKSKPGASRTPGFNPPAEQETP